VESHYRESVFALRVFRIIVALTVFLEKRAVSCWPANDTLFLVGTRRTERGVMAVLGEGEDSARVPLLGAYGNRHSSSIYHKTCAVCFQRLVLFGRFVVDLLSIRTHCKPASFGQYGVANQVNYRRQCSAYISSSTGRACRRSQGCLGQ